MKRYKVIVSAQADKQLSKLDRYTARLILAWIRKNLDGSTNPRARGKGLSANRAGEWRYRVGDWRIIANINDTEVIILVLAVGHRREVY
ncbi:MAG: type II toxin-antitoxin system RelE/ParE family toxin [Actinomycetes bacterium]|jgi:mRNA interferase RelE/StbE|nr:type II toxin-antitoxin system RelE/ParE family toxin [Actinomycetes bacterium]